MAATSDRARVLVIIKYILVLPRWMVFLTSPRKLVIITNKVLCFIALDNLPCSLSSTYYPLSIHGTLSMSLSPHSSLRQFLPLRIYSHLWSTSFFSSFLFLPYPHSISFSYSYYYLYHIVFKISFNHSLTLLFLIILFEIFIRYLIISSYYLLFIFSRTHLCTNPISLQFTVRSYPPSTLR